MAEGRPALQACWKPTEKAANTELTGPGDAAIKAAGRRNKRAMHAAEHSTLGEAIAARLIELAATSDERGRLTRLYLGPGHRAAADTVARWMQEAGMAVRIDALGSVVGSYRSRDGDGGARTLLLGSHIDTVRDAGRFDGALGVVTAIEVVRALAKAGKRFPFAIEVIAFGDEEGVRFPSTLGGARPLAGTFDPRALDEVGEDGLSRRQALTAFGCDPARLTEEVRSPQRTLGYVEVHIEQGPVLEQEGLPVGIVTAIDGVTRAIVEVDGVAGHAGTVPMPMRKDALAAAAEMLLAVEARARAHTNLVATAGKIEVPGAAANTIPGKARFTLDIRSPFDDERRSAVADVEAAIAAIAQRRGVTARLAIGHEVAAATCDAGLSDRLARAVEAHGIAARRLPSGAGHDAMAFDRIIPFAMLFVRCRGGVSHNPREFAAPADIDAAARVLTTFLEGIAP
jgi:allantoate deiminase